MLIRFPADGRAVLYRVLMLISIVCSGLVVTSFVLFGRDQLAGASRQQQTAIVAGAQASAAPVPAHRPRTQPRAFIDGAAHALTSPFRSIVHSSSAWVERAVPTLLALLVYGVGLGYLARFSRGLA